VFVCMCVLRCMINLQQTLRSAPRLVLTAFDFASESQLSWS
jgi:hypothetical protein